VTIDPDNPPSDAEIYASKPMPGVVLGRTGTINEAADAIFWLCSPMSNYVTAQVIPVNGGARGGMS
jgi:3-oxoacyl-[acyl-carrier protein] reductase